MSHSYAKVWLHVVFSTKNRQPLINPDLEKKLFEFLNTESDKLECRLKAINGMPDHIHMLMRISPKIAIAEIIKQLKGASSYWVNHEDMTREKFSWQTGYGVFSVSESQLIKVENYIKNQKAHHKKCSFQDEYTEFIKVHGLSEENG